MQSVSEWEEVGLTVADIYCNNMKLMVKCPMLNIYPQTSEMFLDIRFLVVIWASD